jgi:hypothetical protein
VKVNDLKQQQLEEGFLDNLITKVQDMSGGDGLTGVLRSLRGQGAALNRVADAIKNGFTGTLRKRLGNNFNAVANGQVPAPAGDIIKLAFKSAEAVSDKDGNPVSVGQIVDYFKKNKRAITTIVGAGVSSAVDAIVDVANKQQIESPMPYEQLIDAVAKSMAAAIILIQTADEAGEAGEMDPNEIDQFEQQGNAILTTLLNPTNGLKPNQDYKDNLENLFFVQMVKVIKDKYVSLPNEKLAQLATTPPPLVNIAQLKNYLTAHNPSLDQTVVSDVTREAHARIQAQFKHWLNLAAQETSTGAKAEQSLQLYSTWLQKADDMLNSLKLGTGEPTTDTPPAGKPIPQAGKPETVTVGGQEIKPNDPLYDRIMAAVNGTE